MSSTKTQQAHELADIVRKPVNTLAIVPKSARITLLGRKAYNVLLFEAQEQGLNQTVFRTPLNRIIKGVDFDSNDTEVVKKHLRSMVSTTVEWQSPTEGEGAGWQVSGLLAHAAIKKTSGTLWVEWSYSDPLRKELLEPTIFARLKLEVISQLRSHASVALYEICTRYKDIARTSRQHWRWWHPVLTGAPTSPSLEKLQYRFFKRDTLSPAIAEINAITDIDIELIEHKEGRAIAEIQFSIRPKAQAQTNLPLSSVPPPPVDVRLAQKAIEVGIEADKAEELLVKHGAETFEAGLNSLRERVAKNFPGPVRDKTRYLKTLLEGASLLDDKPDVPSSPHAELAPIGETSKREAKWREEWSRRRREQLIGDINQLSLSEQEALVKELLEDMRSRETHPSIMKRLSTSGWQHPLVLPAMVKFYGLKTMGEGWDAPSASQLLEIAAEVGDL